MILRCPYLLIAAFVLILSGCSRVYHFEARGVVRDADNGRPISNAQVELFDTNGIPHVLVSGGTAAVTTDLQGQFQATFWKGASYKDERTGWTVKVSAEGYEPETIAVGPVKEPKQGNVTYLIFHVSLRKLPA